MGWLAFCGLAAIVIVATIVVWRRWIGPWQDAEELVDAIFNGRPPRKFLISANARAQRLGLALEKVGDRQRELAERVREGELSAQTVFGAMLDGLVVVDGQRQVRLMNRACRRLFGIEGEGRGLPFIEVIRHRSIDRLVLEAVRAREPQRESIQLSRGPSEGRELEVTAVPLGEDSAQMEGAVILFRDVTQLKQMEEIRREFVANVSHELRTPLSIFRGRSEEHTSELQSR